MSYELDDAIQNAVEWIEALCADEYKQRRGAIGDLGEGFCCLGVARHECDQSMRDVCGEYLTDEAAREIGLISGEGKPKWSARRLDSLAELNDERRLTFPQIAKHMLENLHAYFYSDVADGIAEHFWGDA